MASQLLNDLKPPAFELALAFLDACDDAGLEVLIYCTYRSEREQAVLYRQGRPLWQIMEKADELRRQWHRPDLGDLLIDVGPQYESRVVTWAGPGQSIHNYRRAFDCVPLRSGKPVWGTELVEDHRLWQRMGEIGESVGLEWAGRWSPKKREYPHFQQPGVNWRELIMKPEA